jgi:hypothetical protein
MHLHAQLWQPLLHDRTQARTLVQADNSFDALTRMPGHLKSQEQASATVTRLNEQLAGQQPRS